MAGVEQLLAANPQVFGAGATAGIDQLRDRVVDRLLGQAGEVEYRHICSLAELQRADLFIQTQRAGAVEGGHAQRAVGIQGGGRTRHGLGQQGGGAGFAEQVEVVIARCAIGADSHVDPGLPEFFHRAETAGQLEIGFRAMDHAAVALHQQRQVFVINLGHVHSLEARAEQAEARQPGQWPFATLLQALLHFEGGFVHMHMNAGIQLFGEYADVLQLVVAHRIGRVRAKRHAQARVVLEVVEQRQALAQRLVSVTRAGNRKIQYRNADLRANTAVVHQLADGFREEVHVGEAGNAALELFGDGQLGAVMDKLLIDPLGLGRPDVLFQPGHQRQIVRQAAKQGHGGMAVGVDQAWREQAAGQFKHLPGAVLERLGARGDQRNAPVTDAQAMLQQHHASRLDRDQPGGQQQQVEWGLRHGRASGSQ